jgi:hypothetical protein
MGGVMFEKEIARGKEFLDNYYGTKSWVLELDLGELSLKSGCACVLGQLEGDYDHMLDRLDMDEEDAIEHGFCINYHDESVMNADFDVWDKLTEEWRITIKDRLDAGIEL